MTMWWSWRQEIKLPLMLPPIALIPSSPLLTPDGLTIGENDDGPDGTTNSLLFMRIQRSGTYIIRVRAFGAGGTGPFNLRLTRLRPM